MLIGGLDVGTTGCKLTVYNKTGENVFNSYREYDVSRISGEHEINADVIFDAVCDVIKDTVSVHSDLGVIGVTSFGETFVALDEKDNVLLNSMLYTDPRGADEVKILSEKLGENKIISIAGVKPHQMYSLPKVMWIKNNLPEVYKKIKRILLMEDYIIYKLTGNAMIDYSLAARTMALDIRTKCWSKDMFEAAGVDVGLFSTPVNAGNIAGCITKEVSGKLGIQAEIKIVNGCHDQVAAAIGAGVFAVGMAVDGTGTVECITPMFDKIPEDEKLYSEGYSVVPYVFDGTYVCYALSFTGGAVLKWYRDNFAKYENMICEQEGKNVYAELDKKIPDKPTDILVLPHFAGAANPYMDNDAKAMIAGLSIEHTAEDIYKALMEGVTYEMMLNLEHLEACGIVPKSLYAVGGGALSKAWLQIKADILNRPVTALDAKEAGAAGTCMLAATAMGLFKDLHEAKKVFVKEKNTYLPYAENAEFYAKNYKGYRKLYSMMKCIREEIYE